MKLSEAIRLGALLKPQAFGDFTNGIATCAMGAALDAVGMPLAESDDDPHGWSPILEVDDCPVCGQLYDDCDLTVIAHLNDDHRWTREQIADWVETIEREIEAREAMQALSLVGVGIE